MLLIKLECDQTAAMFKLELLEQYGSQGFKSEILKLDSTVNQLQADLNDRSQELLASDVKFQRRVERTQHTCTCALVPSLVFTLKKGN
ncbi:unnamed protein product [Parnassius apollo]|uniref:(apollo) hypothetical protein n=1 Tax=Parnassius apollo TaxID=110799 RepID=A0A8S3XYL5_PARAO|nr:unnamed protein product [Parnassius apollo]